MNNKHIRPDYDSLPLRHELLFDGDLRGWRTGIDCVLELSVMPIWMPNIITDEDRALLELIKTNHGRDETGNYIEYHWIIDEFIDHAKCTYKGLAMRLEWNEGSIFAVPVELNKHESMCLYGEWNE
jgi:hypothetical protein